MLRRRWWLWVVEAITPRDAQRRYMLHLNLRRVHRASALLLVAFACAHIGNHLWALRGAAAHIELMDGLRLVYRHPLVERSR